MTSKIESTNIDEVFRLFDEVVDQENSSIDELNRIVGAMRVIGAANGRKVDKLTSLLESEETEAQIKVKQAKLKQAWDIGLQVLSGIGEAIAAGVSGDAAIGRAVGTALGGGSQLVVAHKQSDLAAIDARIQVLLGRDAASRQDQQGKQSEEANAKQAKERDEQGRHDLIAQMLRG